MRELSESFACALEGIEDLRASSHREAKRFLKAITADGNASGLRFTDQGVYLATASGELLAAGNKLDGERLAKMMREALEDFEGRPEKERSKGPKKVSDGPDRYGKLFPEDGLAVTVFTRLGDVEGEGRRPRRRGRRGADPGFLDPRVNFDTLWISEKKARAMVPRGAKAEDVLDWSEPFGQRLGLFGCVGTARALGAPYAEEDAKELQVEARVVGVDGDEVRLELSGRITLLDESVEAVPGRSRVPAQKTRGVDLEVTGRAVFDRDARRFMRFDVVATGTGHGGSSLGPSGDRPYSVCVQLVDPEDPLGRTKPLLIEHYASKL